MALSVYHIRMCRRVHLQPEWSAWFATEDESVLERSLLCSARAFSSGCVGSGVPDLTVRRTTWALIYVLVMDARHLVTAFLSGEVLATRVRIGCGACVFMPV